MKSNLSTLSYRPTSPSLSAVRFFLVRRPSCCLAYSFSHLCSHFWCCGAVHERSHRYDQDPSAEVSFRISPFCEPNSMPCRFYRATKVPGETALSRTVNVAGQMFQQEGGSFLFSDEFVCARANQTFVCTQSRPSTRASHPVWPVWLLVKPSSSLSVSNHQPQVLWRHLLINAPSFSRRAGEGLYRKPNNQPEVRSGGLKKRQQWLQVVRVPIPAPQDHNLHRSCKAHVNNACSCMNRSLNCLYALSISAFSQAFASAPPPRPPAHNHDHHHRLLLRCDIPFCKLLAFTIYMPWNQRSSKSRRHTVPHAD